MQAKQILDALPHGVIVVDVHNTVSFANPAAARLLGRRADDLLGCCYQELSHLSAFRSLVATRSPCLNMRGNPNGEVIVLMPVAQKFSVDLLTGLANRAGLMQLIPQKMAAVLFLDLDRFKAINDQFGHHAGDAVLSAVAKRLQNCVRQTDVVARFGGDEFVIVLSGQMNKLKIQRIAERILADMAEPFVIDALQIRVGMSIGIACASSRCRNTQALLQQADDAMYSVKAVSGNGFRFKKDS